MQMKENEIVLYQPNEAIRLEVRMADESVWLTQQQIADLFGVRQPAISKHLSNIFKSGELEENSVHSILEYTAADGKLYKTKFYNLDAILSVGYRVNSINATMFRRWANAVLKDYLLKGYAINQRLERLEQRVSKTEEQIDFFVRTSLPPVERVFYNGQFFEARALLEKIIKTARKRVIIIDAYVDAATFEMLDVRQKGINATIYSGKDLAHLRDMHNASVGTLTVDTFVWKNPSHDRWLIVDDQVYHCGHSLKDLGQKLSAVSLMGINAEDILKQVR